jgi:hypothetical protein
VGADGPGCFDEGRDSTFFDLFAPVEQEGLGFVDVVELPE